MPRSLVARALVGLSSLAVCGPTDRAGADPGSTSAPTTTRLVHGPLAFRLTGYEDAPSTTSLGDDRYAVVFKLSRDPRARLPNPEEPAELTVSRGTFYLQGHDLQVSRLNRPGRGSQRCFVGCVDDTNPRFLRRHLDPIELGARIRVSLHPLDVQREGGRRYVKLITRHVSLGTADVALGSTSARRELRRIGC